MLNSHERQRSRSDLSRRRDSISQEPTHPASSLQEPKKILPTPQNRSWRSLPALFVSDILNSIHLRLLLEIMSPSSPASAAVLARAETLLKSFLIPSISPETTNLKITDAVVTVLQKVNLVLCNYFVDRHRRDPQLEGLMPSWLYAQHHAPWYQDLG